MDGPTPYTRCALMDPPAARDVTLGAVRLEVVDRTVTVHAEAEAIRVAVARGPAGAGEPILPMLDAIEAASPSVLILLGDHGDGEGTSDASIAAMVAAFRELAIPVLLLPGGRDQGETLREALPTEGGLLDLSGVRSVRIGDLELVPLPGSPEGRYALEERACGIGEGDLEVIGSDVGGAGEGLRLLLAYAAPATGDARSAGIDGIESGSPLIAAALTRLGARGGIYAFPEAEIGRPYDGTTRLTVPSGPVDTLHLVVPRVLGPSTERSDGSRQTSGVVVLEVSNGVAVLSVP